MNCFNHQTVPAIGLCKHCAKGLCTDCAIDLGHGLACRGHEQEIAEVRAMVSRANATQVTNSRYKYLSPMFFFVLGGVFLFDATRNPGRASTFGMVMGAAFLAYSLVLVFVNRGAFGKSPSA